MSSNINWRLSVVQLEGKWLLWYYFSHLFLQVQAEAAIWCYNKPSFRVLCIKIKELQVQSAKH